LVKALDLIFNLLKCIIVRSLAVSLKQLDVLLSERHTLIILGVLVLLLFIFGLGGCSGTLSVDLLFFRHLYNY